MKERNYTASDLRRYAELDSKEGDLNDSDYMEFLALVDKIPEVGVAWVHAFADALDEIEALRAAGESTGASLISEERRRQVEKEEWSSYHDDIEHEPGELAKAGATYALHAHAALNGFAQVEDHRGVHPDWPWEAEWWKPSHDPIRTLVKAGALIAAEIDRAQRALAAAERVGLGGKP